MTRGYHLIFLAFTPVLSSLLHAALPNINRGPEDITANVGGRTGFAVSVSSDDPVSYQWFHEDNPVPNATTDVFLLTNVQSSTSGTYHVNVTNASGTVTSDDAILRITVPETDLIDPSFVPAVELRPPFSVLSDQTIISQLQDVIPANAPPLVRLNPDGSLHPDFAIPDLIDPDAHGSRINGLWPGPNGTFYVSYTQIFGTHSTGWRCYLARFAANGSLDPTFTPFYSGGTPIKDLVATASGLIVFNGDQLFRLTVQGELDPTFAVSAIQQGRRMEQGADGRVWFGADQLYLVRNDGTLVPHPGPADFRLLPDGGFIGFTTTSVPPHNKFGSILLQRFLPDGSLDASFNAPSVNWSYLQESHQVDARVLPDGRMLVADVPRRTPDPARRGFLSRLLPDGTVDPDFQAVLPMDTFTFGFHYSTYFYPDASHALISSGDTTIRVRLNPSGAPPPPRVLKVQAFTDSVLAGDDYQVSYVAVGPDIEAAPINPFVALNAQSGSTAATLTVRSPWGTATATWIPPAIVESVPRFVRAPDSMTLSPKRRLTLSADIRGTDPITVEWFKDGSLIATPSGYDPLALGEGAGSYRIVASNGLGTTEHTFTVDFGQASRLSNLSTRGYAGVGDEVMIIGFILRGGSARKEVMLRAVGRELRTDFGLDGVLENPRATLFDRYGRTIAEGDDTPFLGSTGGGILARFDDLGAFRINHGPSSLLFDELPPGPYTMHITPATGSPGIVLGEIYDADDLSDRLTNVSTRALVSSGDALAISGFVVSGEVTKRLLIRGIGPTLASFGVSHPLADPVLEVFNAAGEVIASNDNWIDAPDQNALRTATAVLAFPLDEDAADAAFLLEVPPGIYTAQIRGKSDASGVALVEIYEVP